jgi:hypothetical protein
MRDARIGSRFRDRMWAAWRNEVQIAPVFQVEMNQLVEALMHASECRKNADMCFQLAGELPEGQRAFMLDMAEKWLDAARELERDERHTRDADSQPSGI